MALLEQKLNVKLTQKLTLTPALQQAIKLLQMTVPELQAEVREELMSNPLLEEGAVDSDEQQAESERQEPESRDQKEDLHDSELNLEDYFRDSVDDAYIPSSRGLRDRGDLDDISYENMITRPESLFDHLEWQLQMNLDEGPLLELSRDLLRYLDDDGYFQTPVPKHERHLWLAHETGSAEEQVRKAVNIIQDLDPAGVGAFDIRECLLIQARILGFAKDQTLESIISRHLEDLADKRYDEIRKALSLSEEELELYVDFVRKLEPKPGRKYSTERTVYIIPDVYVYKVGDEYQIQLNDDGLPHLRVNRKYASLVGNSRSGLNDEQRATASYVKERLKSAVWIIRSIQNRQRTILKVARAIVATQREFLDQGLEKMKPLTLKDIADEIEMHESTVARVVKNKYMHTPRGLFELRYFFNARIASTRGDDVSSLAVKEKIRKIVDSESSAKPYSDSGIVNILKAHGINIARRTVAKYREELDIASSSERKRTYRRRHEH